MENLAGSSSHPNQAHEPGFDPNSWLTLGTGPQEKQAARQPHACLYCPRTFLSSQDLGGHQHSHGRKRKRGDYAAMFPQTHVPIIPMFGPILSVEPPPGLELGLGLGEGAGRMNPMSPNGYPGLLERRLGLRVDVEKNLLGRMEMAECEDGDDDVIELTEMCIELKNMHGGHESGDGCERKEGVAEDISKEFDLTLRL
ncbi:hypothetical protein AAC387_Pa05g2106 [Persea americana]